MEGIARLAPVVEEVHDDRQHLPSTPRRTANSRSGMVAGANRCGYGSNPRIATLPRKDTKTRRGTADGIALNAAGGIGAALLDTPLPGSTEARSDWFMACAPATVAATAGREGGAAGALVRAPRDADRADHDARRGARGQS
jgi:hypothetical protein